MSASDALLLLALAGAGFVASALNAVAGGGSFLTVPLLILLGLPATEANATNRLGVPGQNIGGVHLTVLKGHAWVRGVVTVAIPAWLLAATA